MLILFQGCTVYKAVPITLEQAVKNEEKVKVTTKSNKKLKFKRIGLEDGTYYGYKIQKGKILKTTLDLKTINNIKEKNRTMSTIATITVSIVSLMGVTIGAWLLAGSPL